MRKLFTLFTVVIMLPLAGCFNSELKRLEEQVATLKNESEEWRKKAEDYRSTFSNFSENVVIAADKIDPAGIKEAMREAKDLRDANQRLMSLLQDTTYQGRVLLESKELVFRIVKYKGDLQVKGWIGESNTHDNVFLDERFTYTAPQVPEPNPFCQDLGNNLMKDLNDEPQAARLFWTKAKVNREADNEYVRWMSGAWGQYLKSMAYEDPPPQKRDRFLRDTLGRDGYHTVYMQVVPLSTDWSIEAQLVRLDANKGEFPMKSFELDPKQGTIKHFIIGVKFIGAN